MPRHPTGEQNEHCRPDRNATGGADGAVREKQELAARLARIRHKVLILSGKGGVGKSTVAVNLALALMDAGRTAGLLDVDIHGPSVPVLLDLKEAALVGGDNGIEPAVYGDGLKVVSMGLMLRDQDDPVIWRGPLKYGAIKQFIKDVNWGDLDYLVVDAPPGTGDEPLSVAQLMEGADGAVIVTTPQEVALSDVRKCINFCRKLSLPVIGVVENMSGLVCPHCGKDVEVFGSGGGERMAGEMSVPFLGRIPLEPAVTELGDAGKPFIRHAAGSVSAVKMADVAVKIMESVESGNPGKG
ncbi:MAG: Mrp/NBP35 family ATP-binding protein [Planctomycetes bacterium]|nr:Mrp/NBP35 family ATP-binding protein [Planctomycetota bacterium]